LRQSVALGGVLQERIDKFRIIHDLSAHYGDSTSVNEDTDFESAPPVRCGTVINDIITRLWQLRQRYTHLPIVIGKMDVTAAFRQVRAATSGILFGYVFGDVVVVDLRLQFGWRCSPGGGN
jgi:hypothetical protein